MADHFGIAVGVMGAAQIYFRSGRLSGRTTSMVESVKDGDRIVFMDGKEAKRVQRLCKERGVNVECIVLSPKHPQEILSRGTSEGRTLFDHAWLENYYMLAIEEAAGRIDVLERETSGFGYAHRETARKAFEISKWQP